MKTIIVALAGLLAGAAMHAENASVSGDSVKKALNAYALSHNQAERTQALQYLAAPETLPLVAQVINDQNLVIADAAIKICEDAKYTPAQQFLLKGLLDTVGITSAGGAENQVIKNNYIKDAWAAYVSLAGKDGLDANNVPSRDELIALSGATK